MRSGFYQKSALLLAGLSLLFVSASNLKSRNSQPGNVVMAALSPAPSANTHKIQPEVLKLYETDKKLCEADKQIKALEKENDILVRFVKMEYYRILDRIWRNYGKEIKTAAAASGIEPDLLAAVIAVESGGRPTATAAHGEKGLMQLRPAICKKMGVVDPFDPAQNIQGGAGYLKELLKEFKEDMTLALAAYNAGPAIVKHYKGMPPWIYTKYYVRKVLYLSRPS
jgi:hypothetical protein